jgi:diadenosine tetraphosphate (Ap4A) HIT family hydrolase
MGFHDQYDRWLRLTEAEHCAICQQAPMPAGMEDIVELPHSWLSAEPVDCLKGACHLIAKRHVVELYELDDADLLAWMQEVQVCARALKTVTGAVKINYEIHGNAVPHLHVHLYPRYRDDPFAGRAIEPREKANLYAEGEFAAFVTAMRQEIARLRGGAGR